MFFVRSPHYKISKQVCFSLSSTGEMFGGIMAAPGLPGRLTQDDVLTEMLYEVSGAPRVALGACVLRPQIIIEVTDLVISQRGGNVPCHF
jgi:hypothetical protein